MNLDRLITVFDNGLRAVAGVHQAARPDPAESVAEEALSAAERSHAAALMRVNHCGEVCAQALYQGQALATENTALVDALSRAAREEEDHLAWCEARIRELDGRTSVLNPLWYAGSLAIGFAAGRLGDAWNLGFLRETERQVEAHLQGHLDRLGMRDQKTRVLLEAMQRDEAGHAMTAERLGARDLPLPVRALMRWSSRLMTGTAYYL